MRVFVDTSAVVTLLDRSDPRLLEDEAALITTNYVLLEMITLVQRRFGFDAARDLLDSIVPLLTVQWVDETLHREGAAALLLANRRQLSLVDCISFLTCRRVAIDAVFAFDVHFAEQGFRLLTAED